MSETGSRERFRRDGFVQVPGAFSSAQLADLQAAIEAAEAAKGEDNVLTQGQLRFYSNLLPHSAQLRAFVSSPAVLGLVWPLVGGGLWVRWDQAVVKRPGAGSFPWHQDNGYSRLHHEHVQVWVALSASTEDNGGLRVVPGSHRRRLPHRKVGQFEQVRGEVEGAVPLAAEAGDAVVFSSLLLHGTGPNTTDHERWAYVVEYVRSRHLDPFVHPPYLVASRRGRPLGEQRRRLPATFNPVEQVRYLGPRLRVRREEGRWRRGTT